MQECFNSYELEVIPRMNDDIQSRQKELDTLVEQKESREIHRATELQRLNELKQTVATECRGVETVYDSLLAG
ncbi:MAG: dynamin [Chloroflexi bacterium AL-N5]|nr:dynamin [Chloroflexi bacterium AL-N5]